MDVEVTISATHAVEGDYMSLTEVLSNKKWLPLPWLSLKFYTGKDLEFTSGTTVSDANYRNDVFHILMYQKITRRQTFRCNKRGYYTISGLELTAWDILMESKYIRKFPCDARLTVFPNTIDMLEMDSLCTRVNGQLRTRIPATSDAFSFRGIREYAQTDAMRDVNFKASARGMGLMVNMRDFVGSRQVEIFFDTKRHSLMYNEYIEERAIKIVASITERMNMQNTPFGITTNAKSIFNNAATISQISEGIGTQHLFMTMEMLAYINTENQEIASLAQNIFNTIDIGTGLNLEYWLVTPYFSKEIDEAYAYAKSKGARIIWIMPGSKPDNIDVNDEIIFV